jgi:hypothetical protein
MVSGPAGRTAYIDADFTQPRKILDNPQLRAVLDLDQPVGLLMIAVLMLARDSDDPWSAVRTLMDELPSGSYLAITHPGQDFDPEAMDAVVAAATSAGKTLFPRERAEVQRFFGDWELVEPGVVPVMTWHPDREPPADTNAAYYWAGLARKRRSPLAARRSPLAARQRRCRTRSTPTLSGLVPPALPLLPGPGIQPGRPDRGAGNASSFTGRVRRGVAGLTKGSPPSASRRPCRTTPPPTPPGSVCRTCAGWPPTAGCRCSRSTSDAALILVDEPRWPGRGHLWSHLVSDVSYAELHAFAEMLGAPRRAFDRGHYDISEARFRSALWLGATCCPPGT